MARMTKWKNPTNAKVAFRLHNGPGNVDDVEIKPGETVLISSAHDRAIQAPRGAGLAPQLERLGEAEGPSTSTVLMPDHRDDMLELAAKEMQKLTLCLRDKLPDDIDMTVSIVDNAVRLLEGVPALREQLSELEARADKAEKAAVEMLEAATKPEEPAKADATAKDAKADKPPAKK